MIAESRSLTSKSREAQTTASSHADVTVSQETHLPECRGGDMKEAADGTVVRVSNFSNLEGVIR